MPSETKNENWKLSAQEVIAMLPEAVKPFSYLVGKWVWVEFREKPADNIRESLRVLGFHWNGTRKVWQHAGGHRSRHTTGNPKDHYTVTPVIEEMQATAS